MMLADDLADRSQLFRFAEVGTEPPHHLAVAANDGNKAGLPAADDDVIRREPRITFVEPVVRTDIRCRVDMQPVKAAACGVHASCGLDGVPGGTGESEFVDVVACHPLPQDLALR